MDPAFVEYRFIFDISLNYAASLSAATFHPDGWFSGGPATRPVTALSSGCYAQPFKLPRGFGLLGGRSEIGR